MPSVNSASYYLNIIIKIPYLLTHDYIMHESLNGNRLELINILSD